MNEPPTGEYQLEIAMNREHGDIDAWLAGVDAPASATDDLNRLGFSRQIARGIVNWCSKESLVTALYGPWGSGKTWLGFRIQAELDKNFQDRIRICEFNPWHAQGMEQLTAELFATIGKALGGKQEGGDSITNLWEKFGQLTQIGQLGIAGLAAAGVIASGVGGLAVAGPVLAAFNGLFEIGRKARKSEQPLLMQKVREDLLAKFSAPEFVPLLVTIDDLDRLDDAEIQMIIRMIKTNLNFPNLHFLILGDREQIARALDPISGKQGTRYLEKIVQNPLVVPAPGKERLRGRLREGVGRISQAFGYELEQHGKRFDEFWDSFLSHQLLTFRDIHRLLKVNAFHAGCLFKEGSLEVDLLDLLAIDFLRLYAAPLYSKLAKDPPTRFWNWQNPPGSSSDREKKDSTAALALIENAGVPSEVAAATLAHLFPGFWLAIPKFMTERGGARIFGSPKKLEKHHRPVWSDRYTPLYFELDLHADSLPQHAYLRFRSLRGGNLDMSNLLENWKHNGWRKDLWDRIRSDKEFYPDGEDVRPLLLTISSLSDELADGPNPESELRTCIDLWFQFFGKIPLEERLPFLEKLIQESVGVSLPLECLEDLRGRNKCAFWDSGAKDRGMPEVSEKQIEKLCDKLFEAVQKRFLLELFPIKSVHRLYRLSAAFGAARVEKILASSIASCGHEHVWMVVKVIMVSFAPSYRVDFSLQATDESEDHLPIREWLLRFASETFWRKFASPMRKVPLERIEANLLSHLLKAFTPASRRREKPD